MHLPPSVTEGNILKNDMLLNILRIVLSCDRNVDVHNLLQAPPTVVTLGLVTATDQIDDPDQIDDRFPIGTCFIFAAGITNAEKDFLDQKRTLIWIKTLSGSDGAATVLSVCRPRALTPGVVLMDKSVCVAPNSVEHLQQTVQKLKVTDRSIAAPPATHQPPRYALLLVHTSTPSLHNSPDKACFAHSP